MGYPPLPLPRELPNGSQKAQPWITRIDPNHGQLGVTLSCLKRADGSPAGVSTANIPLLLSRVSDYGSLSGEGQQRSARGRIRTGEW